MESDEKECPFCAETIKLKATKCKHCGSDLPDEESVSPEVAASQKSVEDFKKSAEDVKESGKKAGRTFKGCGGCLLIIILLGIIGALFGSPNKESSEPKSAAPVTSAPKAPTPKVQEPSAPSQVNAEQPTPSSILPEKAMEELPDFVPVHEPQVAAIEPGSAGTGNANDKATNHSENQDVYNKLLAALNKIHPDIMQRGKLENIVYPGSTKTHITLMLFYKSGNIAMQHVEDDTCMIVAEAIEMLDSLKAGPHSNYRIECAGVESVGTGYEVKTYGTANFYGQGGIKYEGDNQASGKKETQEGDGGDAAHQERVAMIKKAVEQAIASGAIKKIDEKKHTIWLDEREWRSSNRDTKEAILNLFKNYFAYVSDYTGLDMQIRSYSSDELLGETGWSGRVKIHK